MNAQFWQSYGLVLGTALLAVVAFWFAWRTRRAGARQDTDDDGSTDHGSENPDTEPILAVEDAADPHAARLAQARQQFEQQLAAIDLDLDTPPAKTAAAPAVTPPSSAAATRRAPVRRKRVRR